MKKIMNITTCAEDTGRYTDRADLRSFFRGYGLDGLEVMQAGILAPPVIAPADVIGVHLRYWPGWMDFWRQDVPRLELEYGDLETCWRHYGGKTPSVLEDACRQDIAFANTMAPEYLVYHVSDCSMIESMRRNYHYRDDEVIDATAALCNAVTDGIKGAPWLLFENLWYPGLTMLDPEMTARLLVQVRYPKCGVMLDTGHLMHTNPALRTPDEAVDYIHRILDRYADLSFIKGIHLHQSLTGDVAMDLMQHWQPVPGDYQARIWEVIGHIFQVDRHQPFATPRVQELIDRIQPAYLVLELISSDRPMHAELLRQQVKFLEK